MKSFLYPRLALSGVKKNIKFYLPYIFACVGMIMVFYITDYLANSEFVAKQPGGAAMSMILTLGSVILGAFSAILLFYTSSFLMKRRKTEFGLYNILGMGKANIAFILFFENLFILIISLTVGLALGILFSKLMEIMLINMVGGKNTLDFYIDWSVIGREILLFSVFFVMILFKSVRQVCYSSAINLLHSKNEGEKPPKSNMIVAILGVILLAAGYVLANIVKNPIFAILVFFGAVILVIIATYLLFISGSVVICKLLKRNKRYYYKTNHFVSTSQMAFRMKRNGAGLASICILATMTLVTISSTSGLYFGTEQILRRMYPRNISIHLNTDDKKYADFCSETIIETARENGVELQNLAQYRYLESYDCAYHGKKLITHEYTESMTEEEIQNLINNTPSTQFLFIPISDYNSVMGTNLTVNRGEALVLKFSSEPKDETFDLIPIRGESYTDDSYDAEGNLIEGEKLRDIEYLKGAGTVDNFVVRDASHLEEFNIMYSASSTRYAFLNDEDFAVQYERYLEDRNEYGYGSEHEGIVETHITTALHHYIGLDLGCNDEKMAKITGAALQKIYQYTEDNPVIEANGKTYPRSDNVYTVGVYESRKDVYGMYGGLFFLGVLFSIVFVLAAVMIMYYKQITEGYEDKSKFEILQKVGMTKNEIRSSVNSSVLTLFFLPLAAACVHTAFAFPLITRLLSLFGPMDVGFLVLVAIGCVLLFALVYVVAYFSTSKSYCKIVS